MTSRRPWISAISWSERAGATRTPSGCWSSRPSPTWNSVGRLILRDQELARDAVQETYLRAWRDLPGLRDPDRFDAWLHRLIVNACLDVLRRRKRR